MLGSKCRLQFLPEKLKQNARTHANKTFEKNNRLFLFKLKVLNDPKMDSILFFQSSRQKKWKSSICLSAFEWPFNSVKNQHSIVNRQIIVSAFFFSVRGNQFEISHTYTYATLRMQPGGLAKQNHQFDGTHHHHQCTIVKNAYRERRNCAKEKKSFSVEHSKIERRVESNRDRKMNKSMRYKKYNAMRYAVIIAVILIIMMMIWLKSSRL